MRRKLPCREVLERHVWWDEMTQAQIAVLYNVHPTTVTFAFKKLGVKHRGRYWQRVKEDDCACGKPVCRVKERKAGKVRWIKSRKCIGCWITHKRKLRRDCELRLGRVKRPRGPYKTKIKMWRMFEK